VEVVHARQVAQPVAQDELSHADHTPAKQSAFIKLRYQSYIKRLLIKIDSLIQ
jgi:hypothetical protein